MSPTAMLRRNRTRILLAFGAVYFLWGSTFLAIKYAIETMPPFLMAGTRFLLAGAILYAAAVLRGAARPSRGDVRMAALTGVLMVVFGNGTVVWSEQSVPSGIVALIVATVPLWMVFIDWMRPTGAAPRTSVLLGVALGLVGIVLLIGPDALSRNATSAPFNTLAAGVVVAGSFSWALGSIVTRTSEPPRSALLSTALQMLTGGLVFLILATSVGEFRGLSFSAISIKSWMAWVYLLVAGSLVGFTAYIYLLGKVSAAKAATYAYVNPVIAVLLGWGFGGEPLNVRMGIAAAVILVGVAIITTTQPPSPQTGEHPVPAPLSRREAA